MLGCLSGSFRSQVYLDVLEAVLPALPLGKLQAAQQAEHHAVLAHDQRVQAPDAPLAGGLYQLPRQPDPQPLPWNLSSTSAAYSAPSVPASRS